MKYTMVKKSQGDYPEPFMCRIYDISPSGYCNQLGLTPPRQAKKKVWLKLKTRTAHQCTHETYDSERRQKYLTGSALYQNDNASMRNFRRLLRNKRVHCRHFKIHNETRQAITKYIWIFYKQQCKQARLGYPSSTTFERQHYKKRLAE